MSLWELPSRRREMEQPAGLPVATGIFETLHALPPSAAIGLVWPGAPGVEATATLAAQAMAETRVGYLDPRPVVLPWRNVRQNLLLGTCDAADTHLAEGMLEVMGLDERGRQRPDRLSALETLALCLGRAMLSYPGLLVIGSLARHPAAAADLRRLCWLEAELGRVTGCRRLHLVETVSEAETFCDFFLHVPSDRAPNPGSRRYAS